MSDKRIGFDTAKLAAEKNFNWKTGSPSYMVNGNFVGEIGSCISCNMYVLAPTQTMLQKWLREVHNIHVTPLIEGWSDLHHNYHAKVTFQKDGFWEWIIPTKGKDNLSYEEALEIGLYEGLKLIPEKK